MWRLAVTSLLGLLAFGFSAAQAAEQLSVEVDSKKTDAAADWSLPPRGGATLAEGQLVIDGLAHRGPEVFLQKPVVGDFVLTCKIRVEPKVLKSTTTRGCFRKSRWPNSSA